MHTNLDKALGGVNDVLLDKLGADYVSLLDGEGVGRVGILRDGSCSMDDFLPLCKTALNTRGLRYYDSGRPVNKIGVLGGSGGSELDEAFEKGCDTYITADIKYDTFLRAAELGINLIDADHFCTENPVISALCVLLSKRFAEVDFRISEVHGQTVHFI